MGIFLHGSWKKFDECEILIFTPKLRLKREKKWFDIFAKVAWEN